MTAMDDARWLTCTNPWEMFEFVERRASGRKLRLFGAACCRRGWHLSSDAQHRNAIVAIECVANGTLTETEFQRVFQPVVRLWSKISPFDGQTSFDRMTAATRHLDGRGAPKYAARFVAMGLAALSGVRDSPSWDAALQAEKAVQCSLLRDIIGSPFAPFEFDPAWLRGDGAVGVGLARHIEASRCFDDLPLLADALERTGCTDRTVLDHCRGPGPHVLGCWVVDALLGRESAVCKGLITESDWQACKSLETLIHFLKDKGTIDQWRQFAVVCCRRIDSLITDPRSRLALDVAERHINGTATDEDLGVARATAQQALEEAKKAEWIAEAEEEFQLTPRYAVASCDWFAAAAVRSAVCRDPRATDADPETYWANYWRPSHEWAVAAVGFHVYATLLGERGDEEVQHADAMVWMPETGKMTSGSSPARVKGLARAAEHEEERVQCEILRNLFGDFLGPPGDEAAWLPSGGAGPAAEWWCKLPTTRG
jgi:hypothetical protein